MSDVTGAPKKFQKSPSASLTADGLLIVAAMPEELQGLFEAAQIPVVYTGLGKVNACYFLMRALAQLRELGQIPRAVVNFGTAGSSSFKTHSLVEITKFVQRDMDVTALGFARGTTPYDTEPAVIAVEKVLSQLVSGCCGTGDNFEITHPETQFAAHDEELQPSFFGEAPRSLLLPHYDVVDMEAYALAKVCLFEDLRFVAVKYISDGADHSASNDWVANLPRAAAEFFKIYPTLTRLLPTTD